MVVHPYFFGNFSEELPSDTATTLLINNLSAKDQGDYRCTAMYASNQELVANGKIDVFSSNLSLIQQIIF